jgi:predicted O-methyltransferase YrrM
MSDKDSEERAAMEAPLLELLAELEALGRANDARETDRAKKLLNLERDTAHLISIMVRAGRRTRILEIGTSNGYSTIWLAWSAHIVGGRVWSIDREPGKHKSADANLRRAGLRERVELLTGDATEMVKGLAGPFDLVFFDADRVSAAEQLRLLAPKLSAGALVLADNALSHPEEIADYLVAVQALPGFEHVIVPVGKGLSVAYDGR